MLLIVVMATVGFVAALKTWKTKTIRLIHKTGQFEIIETKWWNAFPNKTMRTDRFQYDKDNQEWKRLHTDGETTPIGDAIDIN